MSFCCLRSLSSIWLSVMGGPLPRPAAIGQALRVSNPRILLESNRIKHHCLPFYNRNHYQVRTSTVPWLFRMVIGRAGDYPASIRSTRSVRPKSVPAQNTDDDNQHPGGVRHCSPAMKGGDLESNHAFRAFLYHHTSDVITARGDEMKNLALAMLIFLLAHSCALLRRQRRSPSP